MSMTQQAQQVSCKWCISDQIQYCQAEKTTLYAGKHIVHAYDFYLCLCCNKIFRTPKQLIDEIDCVKKLAINYRLKGTF